MAQEKEWREENLIAMNQTVIDLEVEIEHEGERLDKYLALIYPDQSRSYFQKIIKDGNRHWFFYAFDIL